MKPKETLYPGRVKNPEALDGTWVGTRIELFKALYRGGSDEMGLDESGVPMGAWLATVFPVGIVVVCGTIVEWAIWIGMVELGPTDYVYEPTKR
jgi:hypothetical protein